MQTEDLLLSPTVFTADVNITMRDAVRETQTNPQACLCNEILSYLFSEWFGNADVLHCGYIAEILVCQCL